MPTLFLGLPHQPPAPGVVASPAGVVFGTCWPSCATAKDVKSENASTSKFHEPIWWNAFTPLNLTFHSIPTG